MTHLSRLAAPKTWSVKKKLNKWITRPKPGTHSIKECVPLNILLKDMLNYAKTAREVKKILNSGKVKIDNVVRKEPNFGVGLMDVITIENENYRLLLNKKGKFILHQIKKDEASIKPLKIINKTSLKKKKIQLNFYDGRNITVDKDSYKVLDTITYDLSNKKLLSTIKFEKGAIAYITNGKKVGEVGSIVEIIPSRDNHPVKIKLEKGKETFETLRSYVFIIGKDKPVISLPQNGK